MDVIERKLSEIKPYKNNPRNNDGAVDAVAASIKEFGFKQPIVVDSEGVIVAGHTRYKAAKKLKLKTVPVVTADDLTEEQVKAYRLADNKVGELAEWDFDSLADELSDIFDLNMSQFGFDVDMSEPPAEPKDDDYEPAVPAEPKAKPGDLYQLGNHRLICGDSTDKATISRLMGGERADMVFTDPPYNVAIGSKNKVLNENNHKEKGKRIEEDIANDKGMTDEEIGETLWKPAFQNMRDFAKDCCSIYVTMPQGGSHMMMMMMMMSASWQVKHELIWVKSQPTFSMGRLDYDYQHEPICYGWNKTHNFFGNGSQNKSIWHFDKPRESKLHPTMKPIELIANAILNSSQENDAVLDVFGGSGSTLIACEQTNRRCFMCELDPHYIDVIIDRWEQYTGEKAIKLND